MASGEENRDWVLGAGARDEIKSRPPRGTFKFSTSASTRAGRASSAGGRHHHNRRPIRLTRTADSRKIGLSEISRGTKFMAKAKLILEESVRLGAKHQVTIPHRISKALQLRKGDHLLMRLVGRRVELIPASLVPRDQVWFWTPEWQKKEREADADIAAGRLKEFESVDDLLKDLRS